MGQMSVLFGAGREVRSASQAPTVMPGSTGAVQCRGDRARSRRPRRAGCARSGDGRMTAGRGTRFPKSRATVSLCDAFPVRFKLRNDSERIAAESLTLPESCYVLATCRGTLVSIALDGVLGCRTSDDWVTDFVKLGTTRSRIRIGEESNGFPRMTGPPTHVAKTTPCTVGKSLILLKGAVARMEQSGMRGAKAKNPGLRCAPSGLRHRRLLRLRDLGRLGGGDEAGRFQHRRPSGVGTFSQNGTKIRVPATGQRRSRCCAGRRGI